MSKSKHLIINKKTFAWLRLKECLLNMKGDQLEMISNRWRNIISGWRDINLRGRDIISWWRDIILRWRDIISRWMDIISIRRDIISRWSGINWRWKDINSRWWVFTSRWRDINSIWRNIISSVINFFASVGSIFFTTDPFTLGNVFYHIRKYMCHCWYFTSSCLCFSFGL